MNQSNHQYLRLLYLLLFFPAVACNKFLELDAPKTELITPKVFANNSTANAAILSIYARMASAGGVPSRDIPWLSGLSSDEFVNYSTVPDILDFYTNSLQPVNSNVSGYLWTPYYNLIFQCNALIEGVEQSVTLSEPVRTQLIGEAKFLRAYFHFYLLNFFGDIPYITTTDYTVTSRLPRIPVSAVYEFIQKDLLDAKGLLNPSYVGSDGITTSAERVRPNRNAAQALLARVYLYTKNYEAAEAEATELIDHSSYALLPDVKNVFLKNSAEAIWQLMPVPNVVTNEAAMFVLSGAPTSIINKSISLSDHVLNFFDQNDTRLHNWIGSVDASGKTYRFSWKYKNANSGTNTTEYSMILRLAEQYLIRAEARAQQGLKKLAIDDLNALRTRAGVTTYISDLVSDPLPLIEQERVRELFAEGHRWFDLKRTYKLDLVMGQITLQKGGKWRTEAQLFPIPKIERDNNINLTQNNGY